MMSCRILVIHKTDILWNKEFLYRCTIVHSPKIF